MSARRNPAGGQASGVEIQNQDGDRIVDETTGTITAWVERGPEGKRGPLWEVAVERLSEDEPWSIYAAFEGQNDGTVDFGEMQRCVDAGKDAARELMRLQNRDLWTRGEVVARHAELFGKPAKIADYISQHSFRCRMRGCLHSGLWHVADFEHEVVHTAFHVRGCGWALEVATEPGGDLWVVMSEKGRRATAYEPRDFATAWEQVQRRVDRLNGGAARG